MDPLTPARRRRDGVVFYELGKRDIVALLGAARRGRQSAPYRLLSYPRSRDRDRYRRGGPLWYDGRAP